MNRIPTIVAVLALFAASASAQTRTADTTVFGFHLGGKVTLPECARAETPQHVIDRIAFLKKTRAENLNAAKESGDKVEIEQARVVNPAIVGTAGAMLADEREYRLRLLRADVDAQNSMAALNLKMEQEEEEIARKPDYVTQNPSSPCFEWPDMSTDYVSANTPLVTAHIKINLPIDQSPAILSGVEAESQVVNGNLESIWFFTAGLVSQDKVLVALEKKYGKPSRLREDRKQNSFGALFISHYAEWRLANLMITFWGATDSVDSGSVRIETKKGSTFAAAALKELQKGPKL